MLIIRRAQMAAFQTEVERHFAERVEAHIAHTYPEHARALGEARLRALVKTGLEARARLGISGDGAAVTLIALMVEFGERFERSPERAWAERMLADAALPGDVKVGAIRARFDAMTGGRRLSPP
ncbi:hypothetical protein ACN28E_22435 [Archangium lansingense]|uniref:hypothetical protein n=1 Tax=Archangium lansingense TaxID=2995310 RepID=UPI003B7BE75C